MRFLFPFAWGVARTWTKLEAPPLRVAFLDINGLMTRGWQAYFRQIYDRLKNEETLGNWP